MIKTCCGFYWRGGAGDARGAPKTTAMRYFDILNQCRQSIARKN
jgi:hypothetical protein